ncbi:hypothetical protein [Clostridium cylindrosporum]|uniref:Uncharacterized protein n=1 Tax=Clostridium cylindrosporum DSM 605 TaxID=1121307 RepID=A0A0J8DEV1_CLOCY|nr:hypothetical protein [Clostridium cylindrosporum]KMT22769.1 hypothetical protein CLCY_5c00080 [Clostridium cylindrosporum DSM 605]
MKKIIPAAFLIAATIFSSVAMLKIDGLEVEAKEDNNIFLEEVNKPEGSGYIYDGEDKINIPVQNR